MSRCHKAINPQEDSTISVKSTHQGEAADKGQRQVSMLVVTSGDDIRNVEISFLALYINSMPNRENIILLFYIVSGVMVGIVCKKIMSVISGQLALSIGYLLFN